jgi:hypothetical protein
MRRTAPLFTIDPGWLFTLAGLAVMVSAALLPAEIDLHELRQQRAAIEARESWNRERLAAYDRFLADLDRRDPALLRRLAASQLNLMPKGEQPLLMATSIEHTVSDWIDATVPPLEFRAMPAPDTLLSRLADGPRRLWLMGGGALAVFAGLVLGFGVSQRPHFAADSLDAWAPPESTDEAAIAVGGSASEAGATEAALAEDSCSDVHELALETVEVDAPEASAEALEHEAFQWPEPEPPFEAAESDSHASLDGAASVIDATIVDQGEDAWLRAHGSD